MTLIQIQEAAIDKLDVSRSSERRYAKLRGSVYRWYVKQVAELGFSGKDAQGHSIVDAQWRDVRDISELRRNAECE